MAAYSSCWRSAAFNKHLLLRNFTYASEKMRPKRLLSQLIRGKTIKIGCACGFWGDTAVAAPQLIYGAKVDYIMFDYLSEITMSLLTAAKHKTPSLGYAPDFVQVCLAPFIKDIKSKGIKIISNAGGVNPMGCGMALQEVCDKAGVDLNIAVIEGDDLMPELKELKTRGITDMNTGRPFPTSVHSMNAYFGSGPIVRALDLGADVVVMGRCADSAMALAPLIHHFQWKMDDFDLLAAGSLAGHLIECGPQVTGGIFTDWHLVDNWDNIGFPIVEVGSDGHLIVTKPQNTGGLVSTATVSEQLLYEVGDPAHYFLPDVVCDFTDVNIEQITEDKVVVTGAKGNPPSGELKVSATYADGFRSTAVVCVGGPYSKLKAEKTAHAIIQRCQRIFNQLGLQDFDDINIEVLGSEHMYGKNANIPKADVREAVLWLAVQHQEKKALEFFSREVAPAGTGMAPGLCNIVGGRPKVSAILKLFSYLYPRDNFQVSIHMNGKLVEEYVSPPVPTAEYPQKSYNVNQSAKKATVPLPTGQNTYKLIDLAYARSGDKGNVCNISVIARHPIFLPYLKQALTIEALDEYFQHVFPDRNGPVESRITRYSAPGISALNFVLHNSLGGGGIASLRSDAQGKAFGQMLLDFEIKNLPDITKMINA